jgi:hypothetical protein
MTEEQCGSKSFSCDQPALAVRNLSREATLGRMQIGGQAMGQKAPLRPLKRRGKQTAKASLAKRMAEIHELRKVLSAAEADGRPH